MRTRRISNWLFFAIALFIHFALLAAAYFWSTRTDEKRSPPSLAVELLVPAAPAPPAQPAPPSSPAPEKAQPRKKAPLKQQATPKPRPAPRQTAPAPVLTETLPSPAPVNEHTVPSAPAVSASKNPITPATQAAEKTGVSVNASYIASETEKWYPRLSKRYGEQGTVVVRVQVSATGRAERVELKQRSDYPLLDEAAIGLVKSLKYNPAKVDGNPVADWVDIPITFRLSTP